MPQGKLKNKALPLCNMGLTIFRQLTKYQPDQMWDKKKTTQVLQRIQELNDNPHTFDC